MKGYFYIIQSRKRYFRADILARKAKVPVASAKKWILINYEGLSIRVLEKLTDAAEEINPKALRGIVPSRRWIKQFILKSNIDINDLANILNKSKRTIKRWLKGNDKDLIPLTNEELQVLNDKYGLQLVGY